MTVRASPAALYFVAITLRVTVPWHLTPTSPRGKLLESVVEVVRCQVGAEKTFNLGPQRQIARARLVKKSWPVFGRNPFQGRQKNGSLLVECVYQRS